MFRYRVGEEGDWEVHNALTTPNNGTSIQVIGLLPYTVYSFRVVSVNGLGPSLPSRESYYMVTLREGIYIRAPQSSGIKEGSRCFLIGILVNNSLQRIRIDGRE